MRQTMFRRLCWFFVIFTKLAIVHVQAQNPVEDKTTFEAAFQGECFTCIHEIEDTRKTREL